MDNIKKYFENGQYELVIKFTDENDDEECLYYRLKSLVALGKDDEALKLINEHGHLIETEKFEVIKIHLNLLYSHNLYDQVRTALDYYDSLPYISYEVEEYIKEQYKILNNREKNGNNKFHNLSIDEIKNLLLNPTSNDEMLYIFNAIRTMNVRLFLDEIQTFLLSNFDEGVKTICLIILIEQKVMEEISLFKNDVVYNIVPYELDIPLNDISSEKIIKSFETDIKDPSVTNVAIQLFVYYVMDVFPNEINEDEINLLVAAFTIIAYQHLKSDYDIYDIIDKYDLNIDLLLAKVEEIMEIILKKQNKLDN